MNDVTVTSATRDRVVALLLAIKHDAEWRDHCVRQQFTAYHAEATALIAELRPDVAVRESEIVTTVMHIAVASAVSETSR